MRSRSNITCADLKLTQRRDSQILVFLCNLILVRIHHLMLVEYILGI